MTQITEDMSTEISLYRTDSPSQAPTSLTVTSLDKLRALEAMAYLLKLVNSTLTDESRSPTSESLAKLEYSNDLDLLQLVSLTDKTMNHMIARVVKLFELRLELRQLEGGGEDNQNLTDDDLEVRSAATTAAVDLYRQCISSSLTPARQRLLPFYFFADRISS